MISCTRSVKIGCIICKIMKDEPHGLCHISEVIDWIMSHERSDKADR